MTEWLVANTSAVKGGKKEHRIEEAPLLHACCNQDHFGTVNIDQDPKNAEVIADITKKLPFEDEEFEAGFMDTPWINAWRWNLAAAIKEMLRVCKVVYVVCPWLYGWRGCKPTEVEISWRPGVNAPIIWAKYVKTAKFWPAYQKYHEELKIKKEKAIMKKMAKALSNIESWPDRWGI